MLQATLNNLTHDISLIELYVKNNQDAGFSDVTRLLEFLSIQIFNATFGYNLKDMNQLSPNFPAIDLADSSSRVAVQVTTTANAKKVMHTIQQFEKKQFDKIYDKLYIYGFLKCSNVKSLPTYCHLIKTGDIISALSAKNDEDRIQEIIDAVKQHSDFSRIHPYDDTRCFEVILGVIDRNAIKHRIRCEGSYDDMVKGLNEITEVISKGMIGKKHKGKCIDDFYDESIKACLREIRNDIGKIISIVNQSRIPNHNYYDIDWNGMRQIDELKVSIMDRCNVTARQLGIQSGLRPI